MALDKVVGSSINCKKHIIPTIQASLLECCPNYLELSRVAAYLLDAGAVNVSFVANLIGTSATIVCITLAGH